MINVKWAIAHGCEQFSLRAEKTETFPIVHELTLLEQPMVTAVALKQEHEKDWSFKELVVGLEFNQNGKLYQRSNRKSCIWILENG